MARRSELEDPLPKTVEPALAGVAGRRALSKTASGFIRPGGYARRIDDWWVNACWAAGASLIAAIRVIWRAMRAAGRTVLTSVDHVKAGYFFGHPRIPPGRLRLTIGLDIRRALPLFVSGVALCATTAVVLLTPWIASTRRLGEAPGSAAKIPEAPIPLPASLPAGASSAGAVRSATDASIARQDARGIPLTTPARLSAAAPAAAPGGNRTARAAARDTVEPNRVEASVPLRRPLAVPRPPPVPDYRGSLAVTSSPEGARVFVNGVSVGATPLLLADMPVGSRAVRVELDGHERWSAAVRVVASEQTRVAAKLLPSSSR